MTAVKMPLGNVGRKYLQKSAKAMEGAEWGVSLFADILYG